MATDLTPSNSEISALRELGDEFARAIRIDTSPAKHRRRLIVAGIAALVLVPTGGFAIAEISNQVDPDNDGRLDRHDLRLLDRNHDHIVTGGEAAAKAGTGEDPEWLIRLRTGGAAVLDHQHLQAFRELKESGRLAEGAQLRLQVLVQALGEEGRNGPGGTSAPHARP